MERESHILKKEMQELPKMPRELIERFTKETHLNFRCKSDRREAYLLCFLVAFNIIIMETFHFEFQLKLQLQISLLQGNL